MIEPDRRFSVAPMMDWTDRHCRYFMRAITRRTLLYTEMIPAAAIVRGNARRLLEFDAFEQPVALQIGGSDPVELARATRLGTAAGYSEINLNVGCPSARVSSGRFGACLFLEPDVVAACVSAMAAETGLPVTVKTRVGVDDHDTDDHLFRFVARVAEAGCRTFVVHARKAWLKGLSPKQNRTIPALDYERVQRLKTAFPELEIIVNGGIEDIETAMVHLAGADGVMLGRGAYRNPYMLAGVDAAIFGKPGPKPTRRDVVEVMYHYASRQLEQGQRLHAITRHMLGLYHGQPGAKQWRRTIGGVTTASGESDPGILLSVLDELANVA